MSLTIEAVDRIFDRMEGAYMGAWERALGSVPINTVKSAWLAELAEFGRSRDSLMRIAWALDHLPDRPPSAPAFKALCRAAPAPAEPVQRLAPPEPADPSRVAAEIAKLAPKLAPRAAGGIDHKAWAKTIVARHEAGDRILPCTLKFARDALRSHLQPETVE